MSIKRKSFIEGQFEGVISNKEILCLEDNLFAAQENLKMLKNKIKKIQDNCEHTLQFSSTGAYEDLYVCTQCRFEYFK